MTIWREEKLHSAWRAKFEVSNLVYEENSEFQNIVVFDNENYDRILMIDDIVQLSTRDEFIYHEMMSHVALFSVEKPASVLIIGGGDGGILREVLGIPASPAPFFASWTKRSSTYARNTSPKYLAVRSATPVRASKSWMAQNSWLKRRRRSTPIFINPPIP